MELIVKVSGRNLIFVHNKIIGILVSLIMDLLHNFIVRITTMAAVGTLFHAIVLKDWFSLHVCERMLGPDIRF